ncbi:MAG: intradiol ring-cleavage dioxygenase [Sphingobium sp.]|nr:intradiol ring-cleavage dioxygenase [Sphingobium sp.]
MIRSDIRPSFIGSQRRAPGVPLQLSISLVDTRGCAPLAGRAIYVWQNDAAGLYSLYSAPQESYLRGLQPADARGIARFTSIVPGCYGGRSPHIHFEVYASLDAAVKGERALLSSQFRIPDHVCTAVYADRALYAGSSENLRAYPADRDYVFGDNTAGELAAMTLNATGSAPRGYEARVTVAIA